MQQDAKISSGTRLASMLMDHMFMCMIFALFFLPVMIHSFENEFTISHEQTDGLNLSGPLYYIGMIGFAFYFCKDGIQGRSLAKRITKLQVMDNKTGDAASALQCFIRNIFCVIWPVEVIMVLNNPHRRIGDLVAGTKVVFYDRSKEQTKNGLFKSLLILVITYCLLLAVMLPFKFFSSSPHKKEFIESSYNAAASIALEKLYDVDSLPLLFRTSAKVYDSGVNNRKYISMIFIFKENYFNDPDKEKEIEQRTVEILYDAYPPNTFSGHCQYIYKEDHLMQDYTTDLGLKVVQDEK
jgi:uncharacterized RDD family membrane protein YckC